tara:strand:- start:4455 stop:4745 length:291 start_codon:yes stop_codon:yes gene_type:complete
MRVEIKKATQKGKKLKAIFYDDEGKKLKTVAFGKLGASDFTKNKDEERKKRYDARHEPRENWNDPMTAGALAKYILWNLPTLKASIADFKKRFDLK